MRKLTRWQTIALAVAAVVVIVLAYQNGFGAMQRGAPATPTTTVSP